MYLSAIDWSLVGGKALQFVMSFSILVVLHELGHYLPAKWFKCRIEKFYLFFDPWFSLVKKKIGDTEWGLGWVPFGGYVKIAGMVDESMDKEQLKQPPQPWEFRSKPAWQRLIIMVGGVVVNIILAILLFVMITWVWGEEYIPAKNLRYGVTVDSLGSRIGMKDGDKIIAIGDQPYEKVGSATLLFIQHEPDNITIDRQGTEMKLPIPKGFVSQLNKNKGGGFTYLRFPIVVDSIDKERVLISGDAIQIGDTLLSIDGKQVQWSSDLNKVPAIKDKKVWLTFKKPSGDTSRTEVAFDAEGVNYITFKSPGQVLGTFKKTYTFTEAVPAGWKKCWETLSNYIQNLKQLFVSDEIKVNDSLGSVLSIGNAFSGDLNDWQGFWVMTAIFSIILAFMNILPIPALDGGHALFCIFEIITGRKPSDKFMEYAQTAGMVLLLGLMLYALGLDIFRYVIDLFR
jgi:regulator of sigma E protease